MHGHHGEDPTEGGQRRSTRTPAVQHEPRIQQLSDDLEKRGCTRSICRSGVDSTRTPASRRGTSRCIRCDRVDGFPCLVDAKADAQVICVDPALEHPNVELVTNAHGQSARDRRRRPDRHAAWSPLDGRTAVAFTGDVVVVVSCGAVNSAVLLLRSASDAAPARSREQTRRGGRQLHAAQQPGRSWLFRRSRTRRSSRRPSPSTTGTQGRTTGTTRWVASKRPSASPTRSRSAAARRDGPASCPPTCLSRWSPGTPSTSGCAGRTCRSRRTG